MKCVKNFLFKYLFIIYCICTLCFETDLTRLVQALLETTKQFFSKKIK